MGEKDESKKGGGEKKADAGGKKDDGPITVVLKLDLHCQGCAKKIKRSIRHFEGVERVKADCESNKLTVTGKVDPTRLKERLEYKTKMKVEILSPQPKKDGGGGSAAVEKKPNDKSDKKPDEKRPDEKKPDDKKPKQEPQESTVVMKIRLHCDGCIHKIKRIIKKTDGVTKVTTDLQKDLVTIVGTMNLKELIPSLKEKLKRNVEIIPPKKDDKGTEKKEGGGSGGEKKDSKATTSGGDGGKGGETKVEASKIEYYGYTPDIHTMPAYNHNYYNQDYGIPINNYEHVNYGYVNHGYIDHGYVNHGHVNHGYAMEYFQPPVPSHSGYFNYAHSHQMFSDENPIGCFIM